jgi:hypothetical protein
MYLIINTRTGQTVGKAKTKAGARASKDKRDNAYGAYVHSIREVMADGSQRFAM